MEYFSIYCLDFLIDLFSSDNAFVKMIARCTGVGIIALSLSDLSFLQEPFSMVSVVQPAYADVRAQQKRTYFRFSPKVIYAGSFQSDSIITYILLCVSLSLAVRIMPVT